MNKQYKIFRQSYWDEYGVESSASYYIREYKTFFGMPYWKTIEHKVSGIGGSYYTKTTFRTIEIAETFIKENLCPNMGRSEWVETEVKQLGCKL
jgi:predicted metal-dependent phosphoesterase TrpH